MEMENLLKEGKKEKLFLPIVEIVRVVFDVLLLVIVAILAVRWRKAKNEADDLKEIVNDNIRKDPEAFEMVTMEILQEEQWRRAVKKEEKTYKERFDKRNLSMKMKYAQSMEKVAKMKAASTCRLD
ncbi:uncharacterized protein MONOS_14533 [Monocercomonoides exilis]|uniref:uncharacterized protein n=1 Tax=Monocercomonoides exilis TaxID=2049356 RepID=UPI00355A206F|nr:hypothetical protein MONOS_14533 [Monocercomonoides exilis]|eukprot:MONOS_14533.1-p1 / transcript=MONOS_14533.1 / gene=MONOS_14533 / organism=Monocercomonoides_exilis_PA203 / gene_product=unspecified product / transcript_product=unspecified product / location=Mono_scaffold01019:16453-16830(-) / protein_length=126 / sequence_SO=supercontig / SO=protein_coding / is_pseudo=false